MPAPHNNQLDQQSPRHKDENRSTASGVVGTCFLAQLEVVQSAAASGPVRGPDHYAPECVAWHGRHTAPSRVLVEPGVRGTTEEPPGSNPAGLWDCERLVSRIKAARVAGPRSRTVGL